MTHDLGPRRLLLLRHAKAEHAERLADIQRPLALAGRRQAGRVGAALAAEWLVPDLVLGSSSVRTRQTWDLVRVAFGSEPEVRFDERLYLAHARDLLAIVQGVPDEVRTLLIVGHEPTVSHLAASLAGPDSDPGAVARVRVGVPTASWSELVVDSGWADLAAGTANLRRVVLAD